MPNRLINETSPYLLQHAHNPVDWYPWGPEALERARAEDRPILLSVGYSACHWCHVMERESFENEETAALMNESFVCIKVDREERPDIDSIYMTAVQALSGQGGWPMTVFLTPDGKPFYGGTYYPPEDRHGMPGFPRVLQSIARTFKESRGEVTLATGRLLNQMQQLTATPPSVDPLTVDVLHQAYRGIASQFDGKYGGVGSQPKFPQPMTYEFLLRYHLRTGDPQALSMVRLTLDLMAEGGIYDQIGGGFHRYSTDAFWLVPHFEKMLYDNALLVRLYLHAYQITGTPLYKRIAEETLDYVTREMTGPLGGFYSAQDADSEGVEGMFFVWTPQELAAVLEGADCDLLSRYYGVTGEGNFEGKTILSVETDEASLAAEAGMSEEKLREALKRSRTRLFDERERRVHPGRDDKIITSWNGLMLAAFAEAGAVLGRTDLLDAARKNAGFVLDRMRLDGRLLRSFKDGQAKLNGYLEDYAFLADALLVLHEATLEARWLKEAIDLADGMVDLFWDEVAGQLYDTGRDHEELVIRPRDISDNAIPSGSSMAASVLLRLAVITGSSDHARRATASLRSMREFMGRAPMGSGHWLGALDFYLSTPKEIAIVGGVGEADTSALLSEVHRRFLPNSVVVGSAGDDGLPNGLPLLEGRDRLNGAATAYVCENYACQLPTGDPGILAEQLA